MWEEPAYRFSFDAFHSMAGLRSGCRFYTSGRRQYARLLLLAGFGAERGAGVELVEVSLEFFFGVFLQPREFDAHTNPGIFGANDGGGREPFVFDPQVDAEGGTDGKRHYGLHVAAISADVGGMHAQWSIDALIAHFERIGNLMPRELSAIVVALLRAFVRFHIRWQS